MIAAQFIILGVATLAVELFALCVTAIIAFITLLNVRALRQQSELLYRQFSSTHYPNVLVYLGRDTIDQNTNNASNQIRLTVENTGQGTAFDVAVKFENPETKYLFESKVVGFKDIRIPILPPQTGFVVNEFELDDAEKANWLASPPHVSAEYRAKYFGEQGESKKLIQSDYVLVWGGCLDPRHR